MIEPPDDHKGKGYTRTTELPPGNVLSFKQKLQRRIVLSLPEFLAQYNPPDYLIDRLLQRGYFYSLTGSTGTGKTAIALLISILVSMPGRQKLGGHDVDHGRVLYITRENPTDVRMRLIGAASQMGFGFDPAAVDFLVLEEIRTIDKKILTRIAEEVAEFGDLALVVVDTSFALFAGDEENSNAQIGKHARTQRELCKLPGRPCVLTLCHPLKSAAGKDSMIPRGGGAFLAEVDGNLCVVSGDDKIVEMHWTGKLRGPDFEKICFRLETLTTTDLSDSKGRLLPTVIAKVISDAQVQEAEEVAIFQEKALLAVMSDEPGGSFADWAKKCGWMTMPKDGKPAEPKKWLVQRVLARLEEQKLVSKVGRSYKLTGAGEKAVAAQKP
jgi:hypothetical protein